MGIIGKGFAIVMFPLSILIVCEHLKIFSLSLPFDKVLIGAVLMIALQLVTLFFVKGAHGLGMMNIATCVIFIIPAAIYLIFGTSLLKETPLILGMFMFVEALYALH